MQMTWWVPPLMTGSVGGRVAAAAVWYVPPHTPPLRGGQSSPLSLLSLFSFTLTLVSCFDSFATLLHP